MNERLRFPRKAIFCPCDDDDDDDDGDTAGFDAVLRAAMLLMMTLVVGICDGQDAGDNDDGVCDGLICPSPYPKPQTLSPKPLYLYTIVV